MRYIKLHSWISVYSVCECYSFCLSSEERHSRMWSGEQWRWHSDAISCSLSTGNNFVWLACIFTHWCWVGEPWQHMLSQLNIAVSDIYRAACQLPAQQWSSQTLYVFCLAHVCSPVNISFQLGLCCPGNLLQYPPAACLAVLFVIHVMCFKSISVRGWTAGWCYQFLLSLY